MRLRLETRFALSAAALVLTGCGYVGDPLPPALRRPNRVVDLAAVQRGTQIIVQFTLPKLTTEGLALNGDEDIELRVGPVDGVFEPAAWLSSADRVPAKAANGAVRTDVGAARYTGRTVVVGVRIHGPKGRDSGWGNMVPLVVVKPLSTPARLRAANAPDAVRLTWTGEAPEFHIYRRVAGSATWVFQGNSAEHGFTDPLIEYGTKYEYFVQAVQKTDENKFAESELSEVLEFQPADKFPPAVPIGLSAAAGTRSVELVWERNVDKDMAFYRLYRDGKRVGDNLVSASFSDTEAEAGKVYKYQVSAVDSADNESGLSEPIESGVS